MRMKLLVTGGSGFIGSALIRYILANTDHQVVNLDKLTYAACPGSLDIADGNASYDFVHADICDRSAVEAVLQHHRPDAIMHLAAETHVDRSIDGPAPFIETNVVGTYQLLSVALDYFRSLPATGQERFVFHHVSTDEVFGALGEHGSFNEATPYSPRSPYSASKAASDHLVMAWHHTYGLPVVASNCSNNYGPYQFVEKLIPLMIVNALRGKALPVYGQGANVRDWIHVDDHASGLLTVLERGAKGESYLIGADAERRNIEVVNEICAHLDELLPDSDFRPHADLISYVEDRPGHDLRYSIDASKIRSELGWRPQVSFADGLRNTVAWYVENRNWWEPMLSERYSGQRLGLVNGGQA